MDLWLRIRWRRALHPYKEPFCEIQDWRPSLRCGPRGLCNHGLRQRGGVETRSERLAHFRRCGLDGHRADKLCRFGDESQH